jgi:sugar lactone lactonase YvrE
MKCEYCKGTVIVPGAAEIQDAGEAMGQVIRQLRAGNKIEAIKAFRQLTGASLVDAKNAVEALERGEPLDITGSTTTVTSEYTDNLQPSSSSFSGTQPKAKSRTTKRGGCGLVWLALILLVVGGVAAVIFSTSKNGIKGSSIIAGLGQILPSSTPAFASSVLSFGTEGTGSGMLNDSRYVGVDRDGTIYAGDYGDGRINIFDSTGKFLRLINLGDKTYIQGMAVAPDGTLYLSYDGEIHRRDAQGNDTILTYNDTDNYPVYFENIALGADGSLIAAGQDEQIVRFGSDGKVNLVIPQAFTAVTGDSELDIQLAIDGLGNIYALGTFNNLVLKYSPDGKYLDRFGGDTQHPAEGVDPGRFQAPDTIAVDGYGRVYVSDIWGVQVFDSNGQYLDFFNPDGVAFGMAFDLDNNLYIASSTPLIIKMSVRKP